MKTGRFLALAVGLALAYPVAVAAQTDDAPATGTETGSGDGGGVGSDITADVQTDDAEADDPEVDEADDLNDPGPETHIEANAEVAASGDDASDDAGDDAEEDPGAHAVVTGAPITERRARPDYDGRPEEGPDAGEVLIWIPRILFGPITVVLDYMLRRPLGFLLETAEREHWDALVFDIFTWNERRSGLVPTFFVAYGLQPSVGLQYFSNDEIARGHHLNVSVGFGGIDYLDAAASYEIHAHHDRLRFRIEADGGRRPDNVFSGVGWDAVSDQYRFREARYNGALQVELRPWRQSFLQIRGGVDGHDFDPDGYVAFAAGNATGNQSVSEGIANDAFPAPPGLEGHVVYRQTVRAALDTREPEPAPGHGVHVEADAEMAFDLNRPLERRWLRYGGAVGAFVDAGHRRVFSIWGLARFADPLGTEPVPFTELIALGQESVLLSGFLQGQLRGRSAATVTLEYSYPIWSRLDAQLHVSVGNVFGEHFEDFEFERLRGSVGFGLAILGDPDERTVFTVAVGTSPFVDGLAIDSFQLLLGSRRGL